jgi:DNA-binding CsgD family transcriptional regulator
MSNIDLDQLKHACGELGEVVIDPVAWPRAMDHLSKAVGATGALLLQSDNRTPDVPYSREIEELRHRYFGDHWHTRDLRAARGVPYLLEGHSVVTDQDILTAEEISKAPFYNELFDPLGFYWFAAIKFFAGQAMWGLSIQRTKHQGLFEADEKRVLAGLSDRLTEVASLTTAVGRIALSSATSALDKVHQPAIAVDRFGRVLDVNAGAAGIFDKHLNIRTYKLFAADAGAMRCLERLSDQLRTSSDLAPLCAEPIVVRRGKKNPVVIRVLPIHGAAQNPFMGARALLVFLDLHAKDIPDARLLAQAFGLTGAEARLASYIGAGESVELAAERLGVSLSTARTQLKAVFAKTNTHRQAELVALIGRLRSFQQQHDDTSFGGC